MLLDNAFMETQLNSMWQKANVLKMIGQPLNDSLVAIAMVISLPTSYLTLCTILMAMDDKLMMDIVINQVLIEEKSKKLPGQTALSAKVMNQAKGKGKAKPGKKGQKKKGTCTYCLKDGHTEEVCYKKKCDAAAKDGMDKLKEKPKEEKTELVAHLAQMDRDSPPPLRLFMAQNFMDKTTMCDWIIDSGASAHMSCQCKWFTTFCQLVPPQSVTVGNGMSIPAVGIGHISIDLKLDGDHMTTTIIRDIYYVPDLDRNLLSVSYLAGFDLEVIFGCNSCQILNRNQVVGKGYKRNSLYLLAATPCLEDQTAYVINGPLSSLNPKLPLSALTSQKTSSEADLEVWHRWLGHVNIQSILKLLKKGMVDGMDISDSEQTHNEEHCIPCLEGKQHRVMIPTESNVESPQVLYRMYLDVCGPMETTAQRGFHYFVTFVDGYLHHLVVKLIKLKSDVPKLTKEYLERAEAETGEHMNFFHSDGGGEYGLTALQDHFKSKGIHHEMTNAYTLQENGISEQMNRTLVEMAHAMLSDTGLPNIYWGDAILYAMHVLNRVPTHAIDGDLTPHKAFTGNKPSVAHLRIFGCRAHVHIPDEKQRKLDAKSIECIFLGFAENRKAYICVHHPSGHVFEL